MLVVGYALALASTPSALARTSTSTSPVASASLATVSSTPIPQLPAVSSAEPASLSTVLRPQRSYLAFELQGARYMKIESGVALDGVTFELATAPTPVDSTPDVVADDHPEVLDVPDAGDEVEGNFEGPEPHDHEHYHEAEEDEVAGEPSEQYYDDHEPYDDGGGPPLEVDEIVGAIGNLEPARAEAERARLPDQVELSGDECVAAVGEVVIVARAWTSSLASEWTAEDIVKRGTVVLAARLHGCAGTDALAMPLERTRTEPFEDDDLLQAAHAAVGAHAGLEVHLNFHPLTHDRTVLVFAAGGSVYQVFAIGPDRSLQRIAAPKLPLREIRVLHDGNGDGRLELYGYSHDSESLLIDAIDGRVIDRDVVRR
jgi:hypothetical protein